MFHPSFFSSPPARGMRSRSPEPRRTVFGEREHTLSGRVRLERRWCGHIASFGSPGHDESMIFITAKFRVRPEDAERWPEIADEFTRAVRAEPGCLWFDWSRSLEDPNEYVLVEAYRDDEAASAHVNSDHFAKAQRDLPPHLVETPRVMNAKIEAQDWFELGEMAVPGRG